MIKYNLGIANLGKTLLNAGLAILISSLIFYFFAKLNNQFLQDHFFIGVLIFIIPIGLFIVWIISQRFKDVFKVTSVGIESENHGIIKWQEIEKCSWETIRGSISIYIKLKNRKRLSIGVSTFKDYSKGYDDLMRFYNEIKDARDKLPLNERFEISKERISSIFTIGFVVLIIGLLITLIVFNMIKK